ncbi:MAG: histone-like nucleoid-structuring protein Lsr2 [Fluviibacter sp.]
MATQTVLIDDMDGGKADVTIAFVVQGTRYSLDLSNKNAKKFWDAINPFIEAATNLDGQREEAIEAEAVAVEQRTIIREWARKKVLRYPIGAAYRNQSKKPTKQPTKSDK